MYLLLVDGTNLVMRYAAAMLPALDDPSPEDVDRVLRGVERAVRECAITAAGCSHVLIGLDSSDSWRRQLYPAYKAQRTISTLAWANRLNIYCRTRGLTVVRALGFEADDVIATLVRRAAVAGHHTAVLSADSDLLALASLYCDVWQFGKRSEARFLRRSMDWIAAKYQLQHAGQLALYKALVGEPGDNLPGVPKIGPVKARALLQVHRTETALWASRDLTAAQVEQGRLMLKLVTLRDDVPLDPIVPADCRLS